MMKRKIIMLLGVVIITFTAKAQTEYETRAEREADRLLDQAREKINSYKTIELGFQYQMENADMGINETMEGKAYLKGDKYRMIVGNNVFISDGETVWNYIDDLYEIHVNYVENMEGGITPTALLENFEEEYNGKFIRQEPYERKTVDLIDLIPRESQAFFKYRVALDANKHSLVYTIAYDRHGGEYTYTMTSFKTNHNLDDALFEFDRNDFPEDADLVDMR
jgi:outer membrane lipoprotein-sorting protein